MTTLGKEEPLKSEQLWLPPQSLFVFLPLPTGSPTARDLILKVTPLITSACNAGKGWWVRVGVSLHTLTLLHHILICHFTTFTGQQLLTLQITYLHCSSTAVTKVKDVLAFSTRKKYPV